MISSVLVTGFFLKNSYFKYISRPRLRLARLKGIHFFGWIHIIIGFSVFRILFLLPRGTVYGSIADLRCFITLIIVGSFACFALGLGLLFSFESVRSLIVFSSFAHLIFGTIGLIPVALNPSNVNFTELIFRLGFLLFSGISVYYFTRPGVKENFANPDSLSRENQELKKD